MKPVSPTELRAGELNEMVVLWRERKEPRQRFCLQLRYIGAYQKELDARYNNVYRVTVV